MGAILPLGYPGVHQLQIGLVHQRGGLQAVILAFPAHIAARHAAQFLVYHRGESI
jgi:hypothetical protein